MDKQNSIFGIIGSILILVSLFMPYFLFYSGFEFILYSFEETDFEDSDDSETIDDGSGLPEEEARPDFLLVNYVLIFIVLPYTNVLVGSIGLFRSINDRATHRWGFFLVNVYVFIMTLSFLAELNYEIIIFGFARIGFWLPLIGSILMCFNSSSGYLVSEIKDNYDYEYDNDIYQSFVKGNNHDGNAVVQEIKSLNPSFSFQGKVNEDGWEICEYPISSGKWWWKNYENQCWELWE